MNTDRSRLVTGLRDDKVPGSVAWCYQTLELFKARFERKEVVDRYWNETLSELERYRVWEKVPPDRPYGDIDAMLKAEVGATRDEIDRSIAPKYADRVKNAAIDPKTGNVLPSDGSVHPGNARQFVGHGQGERAVAGGIGIVTQRKLDRIVSKHPDLHQAIKAGTLSVDAAYRKATGNRGNITIQLKPDRAAKQIRRHFTPAEVAELARLLGES